MGKEENEVQKSIKEYLELRGFSVYRVNNGGVWNQKRKCYIYHGTPGVCDLIAMKPGEQILFIECKAKGKASDKQLEFIELVNNSKGARGFVGLSASHVKSFL